MRWPILCSLLAVAPLLGGCHLLFPFNPDLPSVATDGAPADKEARDEARPPADLLEQDGPIKQDAGPAPSWKVMNAKGLLVADTNTALKIWGVNASEIYIGSGNEIYRCSDNDPQGTDLTCTKVSASAGATINGMSGTSLEVYAVSKQGHVLSKTKNWGSLHHSLIDHFAGIFCNDKPTCLLVGTRDAGPATLQVVYDISGGTLVTPYTNLSAPTFNAIWSKGTTSAVACDDCTVYMYIKNPQHFWNPLKPSGACNKKLLGIWGTGDKDINAVGEGGQRLRWNGAQWMNVGSGGADLNAIWGHEGTYFAVGNGGAIRIRKGGGWTKETTYAGGDLTGVWGLSAEHVYAVGKGARVLRYR